MWKIVSHCWGVACSYFHEWSSWRKEFTTHPLRSIFWSTATSNIRWQTCIPANPQTSFLFSATQQDLIEISLSRSLLLSDEAPNNDNKMCSLVSALWGSSFLWMSFCCSAGNNSDSSFLTFILSFFRLLLIDAWRWLLLEVFRMTVSSSDDDARVSFAFHSLL